MEGVGSWVVKATIYNAKRGIEVGGWGGSNLCWETLIWWGNDTAKTSIKLSNNKPQKPATVELRLEICRWALERCQCVYSKFYIPSTVSSSTAIFELRDLPLRFNFPDLSPSNFPSISVKLLPPRPHVFHTQLIEFFPFSNDLNTFACGTEGTQRKTCCLQ